MWIATAKEEASLIGDVLHDPDDLKAVARYAEWLESRDPLRAEYLRLELIPTEHEDRRMELRRQVDERWLKIITGRRFCVGDDVRILNSPFPCADAWIWEINAKEGLAGVRLHLFGRQLESI